MKKYFITSAIFASFLAPALVSAQISVPAEVPVEVTITSTATAPTAAQIFTACSQISIENRDTAINAARTTYNTTMTNALTIRKEAEKVAVAETDVTAKKQATRAALEAYKKSVQVAQDTLTETRKTVWSTFETDAQSCRDVKKDTHEATVSEKKAEIGKVVTEKKEAVGVKKAELKQLQAEQKAAVEVKKEEIKTMFQAFQEKINAFRAFFTRKPAATTSATVNVNASATVSQ